MSVVLPTDSAKDGEPRTHHSSVSRPALRSFQSLLPPNQQPHRVLTPWVRCAPLPRVSALRMTSHPYSATSSVACKSAHHPLSTCCPALASRWSCLCTLPTAPPESPAPGVRPQFSDTYHGSFLMRGSHCRQCALPDANKMPRVRQVTQQLKANTRSFFISGNPAEQSERTAPFRQEVSCVFSLPL